MSRPQFDDYYTDDDTNIYIEDSLSSQPTDDESSVTDRDLVLEQRATPAIPHASTSIGYASPASASKSWWRTVTLILILTAAALAAGLTLPLLLLNDRVSQASSYGEGSGQDDVESPPTSPPSVGETVVVVSNDGANNGNTTIERVNTDVPVVSPSSQIPTQSPTAFLSNVPAVSHTVAPVISVTDVAIPTTATAATPLQTFSPTSSPTSLSPSATPSIPATPSPTSLPTTYTAGQVLSLVGAVSAVPENLEDITTSEGKAIAWMRNTDQFSTSRIIQRYAIVTMVYSLNILAGVEADGILHSQTDECTWAGIACNDDGFITAIEWLGRNRLGRLPADIGLFSSLTKLDLAENLIVGEIPESLYDLTKLQFLYLQNNLLAGTLSTKIGALSELRKIFLGSNTLTGTIPRELGTLSGSGEARSLEWISFCNNKFNGTIPNGLNLQNLYYLDLGRNFLSGPIPNDWVQGGMNSLRTLYLDYNLLSGELPNELARLGNGAIEQLVINGNQFAGEVPVKNFRSGYLRTFELHNNEFDKMKGDICDLSIFESVDGTMSVFKADCAICVCDLFCDDGRCVQ